MRRRNFLAHTLVAASIARFAAGADATTPMPKRGSHRVAFLLGEGANVIDTAGPWEVFQDAMGSDHRDAFSLYTVAPERKLVRMTGGLEVMPTHALKDAPQPHVVVVPAQKSTAEFARELAGVSLRGGLRFVDNGRIATAGGLTSGIDLALHIVERYLGPEAAQATAAYMEYTRTQ